MEAESASEGAKPASTGTCYRLGSVGQDCQLCLWDLAVPAPRHRLAHASRSALLDSTLPTSVSVCRTHQFLFMLGDAPQLHQAVA